MCGIVGHFGERRDLVLPAGLSRALAALGQRGPDGSGWKGFGSCVLGHTRLALVGPGPAGDQPLENEDRSLALVFNGEIYGFRRLRAELEARGHSFRSSSDAEVVLHLFEERGEKAFAELEGMYAFALFDRTEERLHLVRDRVGEKPLWYRILDGGIVFASEASALRLLAPAPAVLDADALVAYLLRGFVPDPAGFCQGERRLPPGGHLIADRRQGIRLLPTLSAIDRSGADPGVAESEDIESILRRAVGERLDADVPVGVLLSGGIDSSLVASFAVEGRDPAGILTACARFRSEPHDESRQAAQTARFLGTRHLEFEIGPDAALELPQLVRRFGQPFADSSAVALHALAKGVAGHVKAALTGDGGDELFAGYDRHRAYRLAARIPATLGAALALASRFTPRASRTRRFLAALGRGPEAAYLRWTAVFQPEELPGLLVPEVLLAGAGSARMQALAAELDSCRQRASSPLAAIRRFDFTTYLPGDLLTKSDTAGMAAGLELRAPFLDPAVIRRAMAMSDSELSAGRRGKRPLRELARRRLPAGLHSRPKRGFGVPLAEWLRVEPLRSFALDRLLGREFREQGICRPEAIRTLVDEHGNARRDHAARLWCLLALQVFLAETKASPVRLAVPASIS